MLNIKSQKIRRERYLKAILFITIGAVFVVLFFSNEAINKCMAYGGQFSVKTNDGATVSGTVFNLDDFFRNFNKLLLTSEEHPAEKALSIERNHAEKYASNIAKYANTHSSSELKNLVTNLSNNSSGNHSVNVKTSGGGGNVSYDISCNNGVNIDMSINKSTPTSTPTPTPAPAPTPTPAPAPAPTPAPTPCQPIYGSPYCSLILQNNTCANNCGKTIIIKKAYCMEDDINGCGEPKVVPINKCSSGCVDETKTCSACYNPWKEVAP